MTLTPQLQVGRIGSLAAGGFLVPWESGEEPGGELFRRPAELLTDQSSSETRPCGQLGHPAWLDAIFDNLPTIIKDQKVAVMQCFHLWWVFCLGGWLSPKCG